MALPLTETGLEYIKLFVTQATVIRHRHSTRRSKRRRMRRLRKAMLFVGAVFGVVLSYQVYMAIHTHPSDVKTAPKGVDVDTSAVDVDDAGVSFK
jgi:hypothetical protein